MTTEAEGDGRLVACAYCGHEVPKGDMFQVRKHIETCDDHPMGKALRAIVALKAENDRLQKRNDQMAGTAADGIAERDRLRKDLADTQGELKRVSEALTRDSSLLLDTTRKRDKLQEEASEHWQRRNAALTEQERLETVIESLHGTLREQTQEVRDAKDQLEFTRKNLVALREEHDRLITIRDRLEQEKEELRLTVVNFKQVRTQERAKDALAVDDYKGQADFHKGRFEECQRHATFFEAGFIVHRFGSLGEMNKFNARWKYGQLFEGGRVYGIVPPQDWVTPEKDDEGKIGPSEYDDEPVENEDEDDEPDALDKVDLEIKLEGVHREIRELRETIRTAIAEKSDPRTLSRAEYVASLPAVQLINIPRGRKVKAMVFSGVKVPEAGLPPLEDGKIRVICTGENGRLTTIITEDDGTTTP